MPTISTASFRAIARSLVLALTCAAILTACPTTPNKKSEPAAPGARLIGTWEQSAEDELSKLASEPPRMTFNQDGTHVLQVKVMGQEIKQESRWHLVEDSPEMIHISTDATETAPAGEARIYFVDPDNIKIGVAQSTKHFNFWRRVK